MKKIILLSIISVISCVTVAAQSEQVNRPVDWAQFDRYSKANTEIICSKILPHAVFLGDSITDSWDEMDHDFFISNNYIGRGISGQTTAQMIVRFRADVINLHPKYVVILAGINDLAMNNGYIAIENIFGNIVSMCELAKYNKIQPIICSLLPTIAFGWRPDLGNPTNDIIALNDMLKKYAKKNGIKYVDYFSKMKDEQQGLKEEYCKVSPEGWLDRLHPSPEGYKVMEAVISKYLK